MWKEISGHEALTGNIDNGTAHASNKDHAALCLSLHLGLVSTSSRSSPQTKEEGQPPPPNRQKGAKGKLTKCRATAVAKRYVPSTLTAHSFRTLSMGYAVASQFSVNPADVTRLSILPWASTISATHLSTDAASETSP